MGRPLLPMIGKRFGRLLVVSRAPDVAHGVPRWNCLCDCGETVVVIGYNLRISTRPTRSCGCLGRSDRPKWTTEEIKKLRSGETFGIDRSRSSIAQKATSLGLVEPRPFVDADRIRQLNEAGKSDREIASALGVSTGAVNKRRRDMGLPSNAWNEAHRRANASHCRRLVEDGVSTNIGANINRMCKKFATEHGWPDNLKPSRIRILNVLAVVGVPIGTRDLADLCGLQTTGSLTPMLADLRRSDLVVSLRGQSDHSRAQAHALGLAALKILERRADAEQKSN